MATLAKRSKPIRFAWPLDPGPGGYGRYAPTPAAKQQTKRSNLQMSSDQQIEKLKGHIQIFSDELQALIQSFELLRVMAEDQKLIKRISGTKRARGFSVNRWSLIQECILGITKLTYDSQPQTPTVKRLIGDILKPEADDLREKLKALFAAPIKASLPFDRTPTAEELAIGEEIDKQEAERLKQDFDRYLSEIEQEWKWFEKHQNKFKSLRDQRLAHLDVAKAGQKYEIKKAPGPEWRTVKEAMEHLINTGELLLTILCKESHSFDQAVELSRRDARDYWEFKSGPRAPKARLA